jgi:hypothetical protein
MSATDQTSQTTAAPAAPIATGRDVQRLALRDLVTLSNQCASTEAHVEQEHDQSLNRIEREFEETSAELQRRHAAARETIDREHHDRLAQLQAKFTEQSAALAAADRAARQRAAHDFDSIDQDAKSKLQQAVWLADSVLEATQNQTRADAKKSKEKYDTRIEELDALNTQAKQALQNFNQKPPHVEQFAPPESIADAGAEYQAQRDALATSVRKLERLFVPSLFVGVRPYLVVLVLLIGAAIFAQGRYGHIPMNRAELNNFDPKWREIGIFTGAAFAAVLLIGTGLWFLGKSHVRNTYVPLSRAMASAMHAARMQFDSEAKARDAKLARATRQRDLEAQAARDRLSPVVAKAARTRDQLLQVAQSDHSRRRKRVEAERDQKQREADDWRNASVAEIDAKRDGDLHAAQEHRATATAQADRTYRDARQSLEHRWKSGLSRISAGFSENDGQLYYPWDDPYWQSWAPPRKFATRVRFGELQIDLKQLTDYVPKHLKLPDRFAVPALLAFPRQASLLIETDRLGRAEAIRTLQMVMTRLLTTLPPGRVRFTMLDPVGLGQNFAGFMHLADYDDALVGGRIWTDQEHIEQRLTDLTDHMETVIQKYLRNEFETIDDYNAQAGELAEPYRFLVIADLPANFNDESMRRLASIAGTGARCGVYTLVMRDTRIPLPANTHMDELQANSVNLVREGDRFVWKDEVFHQFPLTLDAPPDEDALTRLLHVVGSNAKDANRVEVPFETIAPDSGKFWTRSTTEELQVPIGKMGATRLQTLRLGRGVAQHALIAGKTGSGKSTLLHALITNLAMWYSPDEVEFYLVDFKKGVEFKTYATHNLPHARAIAVESDREFGLSVLQRVDAELARRGNIFRKLGVQDLAGYRQANGSIKLPRTLLVIDEFQEFFSEDDKLAQDAALLLDRLVRQGRAFGIHLLLGSQTIGGTSGLARSTIGQMAVRVALQTSEADSQMILGDNNSAARLLSRPGEAIYNDAGGLVEANSPFQVAWLPDDKREQFLSRVREKADQQHVNGEPPVVFEGNAPADITNNRQMVALLGAKSWSTAPGAPLAWLGEPVAIKEPTAITLRRQSGSNVLVVGHHEESELAVMVSSMISLAAQLEPRAAKFYVFDGTPADSALAGSFDRVKQALPHDVTIVEWRAVGDAINELHKQMQQRQTGDHAQGPSIFVFLYGLQRYRILRKQEESFSLSMSDEPKPAAPDKQFADLLREGPALGIHVITWSDTAVAVDRTLDRASLREFDHRVLYQMSAADSSNLIDSPLANKLGFYRALAFSEEQGTIEKFRPYAMPSREWLEHLRTRLASRTS